MEGDGGPHPHREAHRRRFIGSTAIVLAVAVPLAGAGSAAAMPSNSQKTGSSTTLDACGYFLGTQTASNDTTTTGSDGTTYETQHGTWTGVENDYVFTPVASLGTVQGAYTEVTQTAPDGTITGTESFTSDAGKIDQTFTIGPNASFFEVTVTATRNLAFLTSSTAGECYSGPFPRP